MSDPLDKYLEDIPEDVPSGDLLDKYLEDIPSDPIPVSSPVSLVDAYLEDIPEELPVAEEPWFQPPALTELGIHPFEAGKTEKILDMSVGPAEEIRLQPWEIGSPEAEEVKEWYVPVNIETPQQKARWEAEQERKRKEKEGLYSKTTQMLMDRDPRSAIGRAEKQEVLEIEEEINYNLAEAGFLRKKEAYDELPPEEKAKVHAPIRPMSPKEKAELKAEKAVLDLKPVIIGEMMGSRHKGPVADVSFAESPYETIGAGYMATLWNLARTAYEGGAGALSLMLPNLSKTEVEKTKKDLDSVREWFEGFGRTSPIPWMESVVPGFHERFIATGPSAEAVQEVRDLLSIDITDEDKLNDVEIIWPGSEPERPGTYPRFTETATGAVREVVGLYQMGIQLPGAIEGILGKAEMSEKVKTIGTFAGHIADYYSKRIGHVQRGDFQSLVEEAPIGTVFDVGMVLGSFSKAAIAAEANAIRQAIKQGEIWGQPRLARLRRSIDHLDDATLIQKIKSAYAEGKLRGTYALDPTDLGAVQVIKSIANKQKTEKAARLYVTAEAERAASKANLLTGTIDDLMEMQKAATVVVEKARNKLNKATKALDSYGKERVGTINRVLRKFRPEWNRAHRATIRRKTDIDAPWSDKLAAQIEEAAAKKVYYENLSAEVMFNDLIKARAELSAATLKRTKVEGAVKSARKKRRYYKAEKKAGDQLVADTGELLKSLYADKKEAVVVLKAMTRPKIVRNVWAIKKGKVPVNLHLYEAEAYRAMAYLSDTLKKYLTPWGALTGLNALKNRLLDYDRGIPMDAMTKGRLRQLLRDPDLILPEIVLGEIRMAQGAVDDFGFAASELYKRIPKEHLPTVRQAIHFEHEVMTRHFKWVEDADGNIFYKVRLTRRRGGELSYEKFQELQRQAEIMNEWAAPIATIIRNRVTKVGVELDIFKDSSSILGRLWAPNLHGKDVRAIAAMTDQRIRGAALMDNELRKAGVTIEAREWPVDVPLPKKGPASIAGQPTQVAKNKLLQRQKEGVVGGYGMTTDLAEELLYGVADAIRDFELVRAFRRMADDPSVAIRNNFRKIEYIDDAGNVRVRDVKINPDFVKLSDVLKGVDSKVTRNWQELQQKLPTWARTKTADAARAEAATKYGALTDIYVHPDVAYFLKATEDLAAWHRTSKFAKALSLWKAGKTIGSPATHMTNYLSNALVLAPMAGIAPWNPLNWKFLGRAKKEMILGARSEAWKEFVINGGRGRRGTTQRSELALEADTAAAMLQGGAIGRGKNFLAEMEKSSRSILAGENMLKTGWGETVHISKALYRELGLLYQAGDDFWRFSLYLKNRAKGMAIDDAITASRKSFADYENLAGIFHAIKNSTLGVAFVSFEARMSPRVAKWMVENPHQGALLKQLGDYMTMRNMAESGVDIEEINAMRRELPAYVQQTYAPWASVSPGMWDRRANRRGWIGVGKYGPALKFIPDADEIAKWQTPDWDTKTQALKDYVVRQWGGGGPGGAAVAILGFNIHPFFKAKVKGTREQAAVLAQTLLPNFPIIPYSYGYERIKAAKEGVPRKGRLYPETVAEAWAASWLGFKDIEFSVNQLIAYGNKKSPSEYREIKSLEIIKGNLKAIEEDFEKEMARVLGQGFDPQHPKIEEIRQKHVPAIMQLARKIAFIENNFRRRRGLDKKKIIQIFKND